jgi:hypothetical protein
MIWVLDHLQVLKCTSGVLLLELDEQMMGSHRGIQWDIMGIASGKQTVCELENGGFIVDLPIKNCDFP